MKPPHLLLHFSNSSILRTLYTLRNSWFTSFSHARMLHLCPIECAPEQKKKASEDFPCIQPNATEKCMHYLPDHIQIMNFNYKLIKDHQCGLYSIQSFIHVLTYQQDISMAYLKKYDKNSEKKTWDLEKGIIRSIRHWVRKDLLKCVWDWCYMGWGEQKRHSLSSDTTSQLLIYDEWIK